MAELALIFIAYGCSNLGNALIGLGQQGHGVPYPIGFHICGDGLTKDSLKYGFEGSLIDVELGRKLLDSAET